MQMAHFKFCTEVQNAWKEAHVGSITGMVLDSHFCSHGVVSSTVL